MKSLTVWCEPGMAGLEALGCLDSLEQLRILGSAYPKRLSLAPLEGAVRLRELECFGPFRDEEVIGTLPRLQALNLRSLAARRYHFLRQPSIERLKILLGALSDLAFLARLPKLRSLYLWRIRSLSDLRPIERLPRLEELTLTLLPRLKALPDLGANKRLTTLSVELNQRVALEPLLTAPKLKQLTFLATHKSVQPEDFLILRQTGSLQALGLSFKDTRRKRGAEEVTRQLGLRDLFAPTPARRYTHRKK